MLRRLLLAAALAGSLLLAPSFTPAADAAPKKPAKASHVRVTTNTTSVRVRWKRPRSARMTTVCIATSPKAKRCLRSVRTRATIATFRGLKANAGTDFYLRLRTHRGSRSALTPWRRVNLTVGKGPAARAATRANATLLYTWPRATNASGYEIQVSSSSTFRTHLRTERRRDPAAKLSGLNGGMTYFARVRGLNGPKTGPWGPVTRAKAAATPIRASIATYNLCGENKCRSSDSPAWFLRNVPAWSVRKPLAGSLARTASADVVVAQEAGRTTAFHTELPGFSRGAYKSSRATYVRHSRFSILDGGWMTLDDRGKRFATWNLLRDRHTGTAFYVVNAHLEPYKGARLDRLRSTQTGRLIRRVQTLNVHGLPVVWAGDWNSNGSNANQDAYPGGYDAPRKRFAAIDVTNSLGRTPDRTNADLNSANAGIKEPRRSGDHVDAIYVPERGVEVEAWAMLARFSGTGDERQYATPFPSDHNPIVARLRIATG